MSRKGLFAVKGAMKHVFLTLFLMGGATFAVGLLPTYEQAGLLAPILLTLCRVIQGLSAAGEQASAISVSLEHADDDHRAFTSSWTLQGTQAGTLLATAVFIPFTLILTEEQLMSWGWRVPFFVSALVVVTAWVIRRTLEEPPKFHEVSEQLPQADDEEVADHVVPHLALAGEPVLQHPRPGDAPLVAAAERGQRHPQVTGGQHPELAAQPAGRPAVVGDGHDGGELVEGQLGDEVAQCAERGEESVPAAEGDGGLGGVAGHRRLTPARGRGGWRGCRCRGCAGG